jgi:signal transduction histidine kinase
MDGGGLDHERWSGYALNRLTLSRDDFWDYQQLWYFQVVAYTVVFALIRPLSIVERIRHRELENANQQLRESESLLEQRVEQRTAELQTAYEQIQTLNRAKDEFVANVSHELRTPITSMKMQAHLLEAKASPELQPPISAAGDRLSSHIDCCYGCQA